MLSKQTLKFHRNLCEAWVFMCVWQVCMFKVYKFSSIWFCLLLICLPSFVDRSILFGATPRNRMLNESVYVNESVYLGYSL